MTHNEDGAKMSREAGVKVAAAGWKSGEEGCAAWLDVFQAQTLVVRVLEKIIKRDRLLQNGVL